MITLLSPPLRLTLFLSSMDKQITSMIRWVFFVGKLLDRRVGSVFVVQVGQVIKVSKRLEARQCSWRVTSAFPHLGQVILCFVDLVKSFVFDRKSKMREENSA